jgi:hypothetical protein
MAHKECPNCKKSNGPRTRTCECGHDFFAVKSSDDAMTLKPIQAEKNAVPSATKQPVKIESQPVRNPVQLLTSGSNIGSSNSQAIVAPSGPCPIKPQGYKAGWPDGPASDEVIQNWAKSVYEYGQGRLAPDAVVYWSRNYWDVNAYNEFNRVRNQIYLTLVPNRGGEEMNSEI